MPVKKYSKRIFKKKTFAKKGLANRRRNFKKNSMVALIKKVSLKSSETKNTVIINENTQLNHNTPVISTNFLNTTQGVGENNATTNNIACRVGDEVIARGLSFKFWFANKLDRPNVMYKIVFFRYPYFPLGNPAAPAPYYDQGTTNYMIRDLDVEQYKIIKVVKFNLENGAQRIITVGGAQVGAEGHRAISVWLPMKNRRIRYINGSQNPQFYNIGFNIVAYDSFGTSASDTIASYAYSFKFYFKDP